MTATRYRFKASATDLTAEFAATQEGLTIEMGGPERRITWSDVMAVRLWFDPTRFDRERFRCRLATRSGQSLEFASTTCRGVGDFLPQPAEYTAFVQAVHGMLLAHGKNVAYRGGKSGARYLLNLLALGVGLAALSLALSLAGLSYAGPTAIVHLVLVIFGARTAVRWFRHNRPVSYDPRTIPAALLPPVSPAALSALPASSTPSAPTPPARHPSPSASASSSAGPSLPPRRKKPTLDDYGPIAEPGDSSWSSAGGHTTHWADAHRYLEEDLKKWEAEERAWEEAERRAGEPPR